MGALTVSLMCPRSLAAFWDDLCRYGAEVAFRILRMIALAVRVVGGPEDGMVVIPTSDVKMLVGILDEMGRGNTVTVIPVRAK